MPRKALLLVPLLAVLACAPEARRSEAPIGKAVEASLSSGSGSFDHTAWDRLLAGGIRDGWVDYRYFQESRAELDGYLQQVAAADLAGLHPDHLQALLINAYNAYTVRSILEHPAVGSIREIAGVWDEVRHPVGGYAVTLDEIEHNLLRPFFRDPRVHFAVNCASASCAPLPPWAFDGEQLDEQLEARRRAFLQDPRNVSVADRRLLLSRYFDWYGEDFLAEGWVGAAPSLALYVQDYAGDDVRQLIEDSAGEPPVAFVEYDWALNAVVSPDPELRPDVNPPLSEASSTGLVGRLRSWVAGFGPLGPVVYALAYAVLVVAFVPGSALTIGGGVTFGVVQGTLVVWFGANLGAAIAFLLSRTLLRRRVERWVAGNEKFASLDRAVAREGWKIVALTRLSPVFPFTLLNYSYGLTGVGFWPYVLASGLAMIPGTLLYVYLGAAGAQVAEAASGAASWGRTAAQVVGLVATLGVTVLITRTARRALREAETAAAGDG